MLTIKNLNKLNHKTLGKKNFYVERIEEKFDMDGAMFTTKNHKYIFELSNRECAITVILNREPAQKNELGVYFKLHSSTGHIYYITPKEIGNIDMFIDRLRYVALG